MYRSGFQDLKVWQVAKDLAVEIYQLSSSNNKLNKDLKLKSQLCSSAVSISSNIAEGAELNSIKQEIKHWFIARGSCAELKTQLIISYEINFISKIELDRLLDKCDHISRMLYQLIKSKQDI